jgi:O-antigen ligase
MLRSALRSPGSYSLADLRALVAGSPSRRLVAQGVGLVLMTLVVMYVLSGRELPFLIAGAAGLFCFWLFAYPHWGVLAIFAFWFTRFSPTLLGSQHLRLTYIVSALLLVPLALRLLRDRDVWVWRVPQVRYLVAIGGLFLASTLWADFKHPVTLMPELDKTAEMAQDFVTRFLFVVFFLYFMNTRRKIEMIVWLAVALVVASVASAYVTLLTVQSWGRANAAFGIATNPTTFPYVALFGAALLWAYYAEGPPGRWRGWIIPLLVALPVMTLASGSRTGALQLLVFAVLVFLGRSRSWSSTQRIRALLLMACAGLLISLLVPAIALLRATTFAAQSSAPGGQSLIDRLNTFYAAASMFASDPILGVGLGNFLWLHTAHFGLNRLPHNSYLWALIDGGPMVLVLYVLLLYVTYRMLRALETAGPPDLRWLATGLRFNLVLLVVFSLSDDTWLSILFYLQVAAAIALYRLAHASRQEPLPARRHPVARSRGAMAS